MFFPFECRNCRKDKWSIRYDSEDKTHTITCANCGFEEILEDIFNTSRRRKNVSRKRKQTTSKENAKDAKETAEVRIEAKETSE